ncbi:hypothetical protein BJ944DRAFT_3153 [Cunninghamella echinulata]|nr:hypothetical protein BJ944DRAFT_3153 [Cunninghamella echinulata]
MNDTAPELSKDEQSEKMVFDSSHLESWKLRMKQMENKSNNKNMDMNSLIALETLELSNNDEEEELKKRKSIGNEKEDNEERDGDNEEESTLKPITLDDLFHSNQDSHHSSPNGSSISTLKSNELFTPNNHDDNIKLFDQLVSTQFSHINLNDSYINKESINGMSINDHFNKNPSNIPSMISHGQPIRPPLGLMIPTHEHSTIIPLRDTQLGLPIIRDDLHFMPSSSIPIHPPILTPSMSTGTSFVSYQHRRPIIEQQQQPPPFLSSPPPMNNHLNFNNNPENINNSNNSNNNNMMLPPMPMYHHLPIPPPSFYHHRHHPMMMTPLPPPPLQHSSGYIPPGQLPPQLPYHHPSLINNHYMKGDT